MRLNLQHRTVDRGAKFAVTGSASFASEYLLYSVQDVVDFVVYVWSSTVINFFLSKVSYLAMGAITMLPIL